MVLPNPSGNRVYAGAAARLAAAEISLTVPAVDPDSVRITALGGLDHVEFRAPAESAEDRTALARLRSPLLVSRREGDGLVPLDLPAVSGLDEDLVTIPKYPGKTNEQFTQLLVHLACAQLEARPEPYQILDPLCGRGTTTSCVWLAGHHGYGVEADQKAIDAHAAFLRTWLRRKRLKHKVSNDPLRRDGKVLGRRLEASVTDPTTGSVLQLGILPGDTRDSAALWGKRKFDAVIADAPYGVVHGSNHDGRRTRSAKDLLAEAIPVWAGQLRSGGVLALAWNTTGLARESLLGLVSGAGLAPFDEGAWTELAHRVDSSIHRDVLVATRA